MSDSCRYNDIEENFKSLEKLNMLDDHGNNVCNSGFIHVHKYNLNICCPEGYFPNENELKK